MHRFLCSELSFISLGKKCNTKKQPRCEGTVCPAFFQSDILPKKFERQGEGAWSTPHACLSPQIISPEEESEPIALRHSLEPTWLSQPGSEFAHEQGC